MLSVRVPGGYDAQRAYAVDVVLGEFLGVPYSLQVEERSDVRITDEDGGAVVMPDVLFATPREHWLTPRSVPAAPAPRWPLPATLAWPGGPADIAVPFARPAPTGETFRHEGNETWFGVDVLGTAFFMLTRYEEVVAPERDEHARYRADASLCGRSGLITRPIVCEHVEALWRVLRLRWPRLSRRGRSFRPVLTHDVDWPFCIRGQPPVQVFRQLGGDIVLRRDPELALRRAASIPRTLQRGPAGDLCNTFEWIMGLSERSGLRSAFFFIPGRTGGAIDGGYHIEDDAVRAVIGRIASRGHEIGIHPSYNTFRDGEALQREVAVLRRVAGDAGVRQHEWGGRQHYLRFEAPTTWQNWADAGLTYDCTLGYAEAPGFRAGVCWEFPVFNVRTGQRLALRERPLVLMEVSLPLDRRRGVAQIDEVLAQTRLYDGDFVLLWHNNNLIARADRDLYARILEVAGDGPATRVAG